MLDECRDWLLPTIGEMKPLKDHMVCHVKHLMVVPKHGCFMVNDAEPLHCFSSSCSGAGEVLFNAVKGKFPTVQVYPDALWTAFHPGGEFSLRWCHNCFPPLLGGARITFEYIEKSPALIAFNCTPCVRQSRGSPFLRGCRITLAKQRGTIPRFEHRGWRRGKVRMLASILQGLGHNF